MEQYEDRLLRVYAHIRANLAGDLSLDQLADVAALSRFHWHRVFRAMTGETVAQAVRRIRLEVASHLLATGDLPLTQVADRVGYPDLSSFSRAFAAQFGTPPATFRAEGVVRPHHVQTRRRMKMSLPVTIRSEPARVLAALPHRGPYIEIGAAFERLYATISARDLLAQSGGMIGVYYDDPSLTDAAGLRSHAGVVAAPGFEFSAPFERVELPAGRHAVLRYTGPYAGLTGAYDELYCGWLPDSGQVPADSPVYEVYLNSPAEVPPEQLITEICLPLADVPR